MASQCTIHAEGVGVVSLEVSTNHHITTVVARLQIPVSDTKETTAKGNETKDAIDCCNDLCSEVDRITTGGKSSECYSGNEGKKKAR